jgi:opacity protein-like surface antigen
VVRISRWFLAGVLVVAALAASPVSSDAEGPEVERRFDGAQPFSLGVDTSRFRVSTLGTRPVIGTEDPALSSAPYRLIDADLLGTAVSFDLKLRWPSTSGASALGSLAPYLSFGPTVLFPGAEGVSHAGQPGIRSESSMAFGLSWGAGLSWRFARNAELFGGYRFMQFGRDSLSHGERSTSSDTELTGHDFLYGISVRF